MQSHTYEEDMHCFQPYKQTYRCRQRFVCLKSKTIKRITSLTIHTQADTFRNSIFLQRKPDWMNLLELCVFFVVREKCVFFSFFSIFHFFLKKKRLNCNNHKNSTRSEVAPVQNISLLSFITKHWVTQATRVKVRASRKRRRKWQAIFSNQHKRHEITQSSCSNTRKRIYLQTHHHLPLHWPQLPALLWSSSFDQHDLHPDQLQLQVLLLLSFLDHTERKEIKQHG